jgi:hypothetical protein
MTHKAIVFTLSLGQVAALSAMVFAAIALAFLIGIDEGRERLRRKLREQSRQHGADGLRLVPGGARSVGGHR